MAESQQYSTFMVDGFFFGVEVERVQEVIKFQSMTPVPLASRMVRGLINLRGQIVTAIDLRRRLDLKEREEGEEPMNVVIRTDEGAVSLLVDEIGDVLELTEDTLEPPPPTIRGVARDLVIGVHKLEGQLLLILDIDKVITVTQEKVGVGE
ncbi:MAG: chemotaxis protein CheW [Nitrospirae bacterium]|nr:chemotaxis protein CheW [Nitrospirota bacterium]